MKNSQLTNTIMRIAKKYKPDDILHELSIIYEEYSIGSSSGAEVEFWLKCSKATGNLSSGTEKWLNEMVEEQDEGDE